MGFNNFGVRDNCISSYIFPSYVVEELRSIYQGKSGLFKGAEEMWGKWSVSVLMNASLQVWVGGSKELGIRVAGLRVGQRSKENLGDLRRVT